MSKFKPHPGLPELGNDVSDIVIVADGNTMTNPKEDAMSKPKEMIGLPSYDELVRRPELWPVVEAFVENLRTARARAEAERDMLAVSNQGQAMLHEQCTKGLTAELMKSRLDVMAARSDREKAEAKYSKAMRALESLTPSGSEFVGDVDRCVEHIRDRFLSSHRLLIERVLRAREAEAELHKETVLLNAVRTERDDAQDSCKMHAAIVEKIRAENATLKARVEQAETLVAEFQDASGLCRPPEEQGGDPGGVRPQDLRLHLGGLEKEVVQLRGIVDRLPPREEEYA